MFRIKLIQLKGSWLIWQIIKMFRTKLSQYKDLELNWLLLFHNFHSTTVYALCIHGYLLVPGVYSHHICHRAVAGQQEIFAIERDIKNESGWTASQQGEWNGNDLQFGTHQWTKTTSPPQNSNVEWLLLVSAQWLAFNSTNPSDDSAYIMAV